MPRPIEHPPGQTADATGQRQAAHAIPAASFLIRLTALVATGLASTCVGRLPAPTARTPELWRVVDHGEAFYYCLEFEDWSWSPGRQFRVRAIVTSAQGRGGTQLCEVSLQPADEPQLRLLVALCHLYRHGLGGAA